VGCKVTNPPSLFTPPGYTQVIEITGGRTIYIAGQTALHNILLEIEAVLLSFNLIHGAFLPDKMPTIGLGRASGRFLIKVSTS